MSSLTSTSNFSTLKIPKIPKIPRIPIRIYFHICMRGNFHAIVEEIFQDFIDSGLLSVCHSLHITLLGSEENKEILLKKIFQKYSLYSSKIHLRYFDTNVKCYERPCILLLKKDAEEVKEVKEIKDTNDSPLSSSSSSSSTNEPFLCLYVHSKGITRPNHVQVENWRKLMTYFLIHQWRHCVRILCQWNADAVGTLFLDRPQAHFSGNFWWTKDTYLRRLPNEIGMSYQDPEMWIGTCAQFFISLFQHPRPLYHDNIPPEEYQNKEINYFTVRDRRYRWQELSLRPTPFPFFLHPSCTFSIYYGNHSQDQWINSTFLSPRKPMIASSYLFDFSKFLKEEEKQILHVRKNKKQIIHSLYPSNVPFYFVPALEWRHITEIRKLSPNPQCLLPLFQKVVSSFSSNHLFCQPIQVNTERNEKDSKEEFWKISFLLSPPSSPNEKENKENKQHSIYLSTNDVFFIFHS